MELYFGDVVELYFVDHGGVAGYAAGALGSEGQLIGEVEAVDAAFVHELQGVDKAGEHGLADDVADGFALAVGLVEWVSVEHGEAAVVEAYERGIFGVGTGAGLEHLVVEARGVAFDVGVLGGELGKVFFLLAVDGLTLRRA